MEKGGFVFDGSIRNYERTNEKEESYLGNRIVSWVDSWEEYNGDKNKWYKKKMVICHLYETGSHWKGKGWMSINLGECNDGSKFTGVNQAINQTKEFVNFFVENGIDRIKS